MQQRLRHAVLARLGRGLRLRSAAPSIRPSRDRLREVSLRQLVALVCDELLWCLQRGPKGPSIVPHGL